MSYDASAQALRCPFCGSEQLEKQPDAKEIAPDGVVPFVVTREEAIAKMRDWLGKGFWRPGDLATEAAVVKMTPVYVPYWVFQADTDTYWTADTNQTPPGARADWYPVSGQHQGQYAGLLVGASGALTGAETGALCPFDLSGAVPPEKVDLQNIIFERFNVPRKYARPLASQGLEALESQACEEFVPGKCRNLNVNVRITNLASRPMLLPVWIMAYRYRENLFRFLANGQTGRSTGQAPLSYQRIGVAIAVAVIAILLILLWLFAVGGGFRHGSRWTRTPELHRPTEQFAAVAGVLPAEANSADQSLLLRKPTEVGSAFEVRVATKPQSQPRESNPQPPHYECGALPIEARLA